MPPVPTPHTTASSVVLHLLPDLGRRGLLVRLRVRVVAELIHVERVGDFGGEARRVVLVVLGMALVHVRACHHHFGAHGAQVKDLLLAHLVGDDEQQPVALLPGHQRKAQTGVAGRRLDERAARLEPAFAFGGLDEVEADAILDGAAGVLVFELQEQLARAGIEARAASSGVRPIISSAF